MKIQAKLMRVLLRLCQHLVEKSRNNPGYYGWVAAAIIAPDGKSAVGLNVPGDSGKRVHAERSAVMNYENRYGPVPKGCVVVTTCSPCAHDEAGTQGESCAELMNQLGVRLVYCGYQDPTPYAHKAKQNYELMVCDNTGLNDLCSLFASTWLKESTDEVNESLNDNDGSNQRFSQDSKQEKERIVSAYMKKNKLDWKTLRLSDDELKALRTDALSNKHLYPIPTTDRDYLYHGTAKARLSNILERGLSPQERSRWSKEGYGEHSKGRIFLTDTVSKAEFYAREASKSHPVILRVHKDSLSDLTPDNKETPGSFFTTHTIPSKNIEFWNGKKWSSLMKESALPLEESVSQTVYHFSPLYAANEILKQKRFRLTTSLGTKTEKELQPRGTIYYLSTTRSKVGDYTLHSSYKDGVVFKLNGDWLNQNFKGSPVDYWGGMLAPGGFAPNEPVGLKGRYKEMEDRVFSTKPFIDLPSPATKLIQEIHVLLITDKYSHEKMPIYARGVLLNAKRLGIPVWFYDNKEAFILQNKSKSVPITREMAQTLTNPKAEKFGVSHPEWPRRDYFLPWRELYFKNKQSDLSRDADKLRRKVMYPGWDSPDSGLLNDIHNSKKDLPAGLLKLFDIFKKLGIEEPLDYAKYLRDKWEKIGN